MSSAVAVSTPVSTPRLTLIEYNRECGSILTFTPSATNINYSDVNRTSISSTHIETILCASESVIRTIAPHIASNDSDAYRAYVKKHIETEPLTIVFAIEDNHNTESTTNTSTSVSIPSTPLVLGAAVIRRYQNTFNEAKFQIEGLAVAEQYRSRGVGRVIMVSH